MDGWGCLLLGDMMSFPHFVNRYMKSFELCMDDDIVSICTDHLDICDMPLFNYKYVMVALIKIKSFMENKCSN